MPIVASDILFKYSVAASAGDTTAGTAATSLGDQISTTQIASQLLFDDVSGAEAAAGDVEYRCFFVHNNHASLTLQGAVFTLTSQVAGGGAIDVGLDPTATSAKGSASAQAVTVANESTAPAGVTFSAGPLTIGDLAPGQVKAVWARRTVTAGAAAVTGDGFDWSVTGDTLA